MSPRPSLQLRIWGLILLAAVLGAVAWAGCSNGGPTQGTLLALDAATGTELWRANAPTAGMSMPTTADGQVFVAGSVRVNSDVGTLAAFDATSGDLQWQTRYLGAGAAPVNALKVYDGLVVVSQSNGTLNDLHGTALIRGLEVKTGREVWRSDAGAPIHEERPPIDDDGYVLVEGAGSCRQVLSLDRHTGELSWAAAPGVIVPSPFSAITIEGAMAFLLVDSFQCPPRPGEELGILALNLVDGKVIWRAELGVPAGDLNSLLAFTSGDGVVVFGASSTIVVYDAETGMQLWQKDGVIGSGDPWPHSTAIANGNIYVATPGAVEALDARTGERHWQISVAEDRPSLAASNKLVIAASGVAGKAVVLDAVSGARLWESPLPRDGGLPGRGIGPHALPTIADGVVYIAVWGRLEPLTGD